MITKLKDLRNRPGLRCLVAPLFVDNFQQFPSIQVASQVLAEQLGCSYEVVFHAPGNVRGLRITLGSCRSLLACGRILVPIVLFRPPPEAYQAA